ncbi:MAG: S8 family peptidase [Planctomycetota bacterium]
MRAHGLLSFCVLAGLVLATQFVIAQTTPLDSSPASERAPGAWSYAHHAEWITLDEEPHQLAILLQSDLLDSQGRAPLELTAQLVSICVESGLSNFRLDAAKYRGLYLASWRPTVADAADRVAKRAAESRLAEFAQINWTAPVLRYGSVRVIPKPEVFVILDGAPRVATFGDLAAAHGLRVIREFPALEPTLLLQICELPRAVFDCCENLRTWPGVAHAHPNFILELEPFSPPNDPLFGLQWAFDNVGQVAGGTVGADVSALAAWEITTGSAAITIAILDEGVDVDHPDLSANMLAGYDATNSPSPDGIPGNAAAFDPHGTLCAGLAAASGDNGIGIAGLAWNVKILPVRIGYGSYWTEPAWVVDGVTWAVENGADVLSNSWGGGPPTVSEENAFIYATSAGRNGLGAPVVFAAGNSNDDAVAYPAAFPVCIAIGATSPCDERKSPTSCDGMTFWGSNYGAELDLVAPGVLCPSTDIAGAAGSSSGDTLDNFWGTSAACPVVAGGIALLLSVAPQLSEPEVRALLIASAADLVGPLAEDSPGWDPYMGHGRLDVNALLALAPIGATTFVRGDPDRSGAPLDITDAIVILAALFQGGVLPCADAADVDDSGALDLPDAIYLLNYLFAGGPSPAQPFPIEGFDSTPDALGCTP